MIFIIFLLLNTSVMVTLLQVHDYFEHEKFSLSISTLIRMAPPRPLGTPPKEGNHELDEWNYLVVTFLNEGSSRIE